MSADVGDVEAVAAFLAEHQATHQAHLAAALAARAADEAETGHECAFDTPGAGPCETCLTAAQPPARRAEDVLDEVRALHGGVHWCIDAEGRGAEVFEPGTDLWPCPTLALLDADGGGSDV